MNYVVTSPKDAAYNCVAFAAGDTKRKWDPGKLPEHKSPQCVEGPAYGRVVAYMKRQV